MDVEQLVTPLLAVIGQHGGDDQFVRFDMGIGLHWDRLLFVQDRRKKRPKGHIPSGGQRDKRAARFPFHLLSSRLYCRYRNYTDSAKRLAD